MQDEWLRNGSRLGSARLAGLRRNTFLSACQLLEWQLNEYYVGGIMVVVREISWLVDCGARMRSTSGRSRRARFRFHRRTKFPAEVGIY